jgi:hypothetical protein
MATVLATDTRRPTDTATAGNRLGAGCAVAPSNSMAQQGKGAVAKSGDPSAIPGGGE